MNDPFNLQRFVDAQAPVYQQVLAELRAGRKTTHWIWFIFPQAKGLRRSARSEFYGARLARRSPRLPRASGARGPPPWNVRIWRCRTETCLLEQILGGVDAMKFLSAWRSSKTPAERTGCGDDAVQQT